MRVLFVCSGNNKKFEIIPFIRDQGRSLEKQGVSVDYYPVIGKGPLGYLKAGLALRHILKENQYDLIHAHYIHSGLAAMLGAGKVPVVLSLMGDDAYGTYIGVNKVSLLSRVNTLLTFLVQPFVKAIISKSSNIEKFVYLKKKSYVIPNGIDVGKFKPYKNRNMRDMPANKKKQVLFLGDKANVRKNYPLARDAVDLLCRTDVELINPYPVSHEAIPQLLNAADVLVVPSLMEGSPNIVKEAMACNCPIVTTDIGDVRWVLGNTEGCYIASFEASDFSKKIQSALEFSDTVGRTNGAERIKELGLDAETVSKRIINVYTEALNKMKASKRSRSRMKV